jgi:hypothetical protein
MSRISPDAVTPSRQIRRIATAIISLSSLELLAGSIIFASFGINDWSILVIWIPGLIILLLGIYLWLGWRLHWAPFSFIFLLAFIALFYLIAIVFGIFYHEFDVHYFDITGKPININPEILRGEP